ncbi:MAG: type II secretion system F family protein [Candidatus Yonathbacteria bacterium]|nr:type II secretion system F family protein [Candidatus Yonathbacteria bacterium]NTW47562.1 type II secretion system F family protein [Candidatus Yonathbacteria bacterium]
MRFSYIIITKDGERKKGNAVATDKYDLAHRFKEEGSTLVAAKEERVNFFHAIARLQLFSNVSVEERINFAHNLSSMIRAGLPLSRALSIMERQTKNETFKRVLESLMSRIKEGGDLSGGLAMFPGVFSPLFVSMVHAGEESGNLASALEIVGMQIKKNNDIVKKVKGAMIYPSIVISVMVVVGIVMIMKVVPTLTSTFVELNVELPFATQVLIGLSNGLRAYALIIFPVIALLVGLVVAYTKTDNGRYVKDAIVLHVPIVSSIVKQLNTARTARTLSSLLSAGVDIVEAMNITRDVVQNVHFKKIIAHTGESIQKGVPLSKTFSTEDALACYPLLFSEMIAVGEETGKLADMLEENALFFEGEVEEATKNMSTIVEPVLMLIVGVAVGFFAMAMIAPMYSVMSGV